MMLLFLNLIAKDDYSLRVAYGSATDNSLGDILSGNLGSNPEYLSAWALDGGYLLKKEMFDLPINIYAKSSISYFDEGIHNSVYELTAYIKAYWNFEVLKNRFRFGFGEGVSYTSSILRVEYLEATSKSDNNSKYLNYLDISIDFELGKLISYKAMNNTFIGFVIKHRSGIYGLINSVKRGGSNYNCFFIEKNF